MIVTADRLIDLARQECDKRLARANIVSAYLIGSVASGEPLVGGTADIDLVLIHDSLPLRPREFVPLSDKIHHDILNLPRDHFDPPRRLRTHADIVPELCSAIRLHDPDHFFDWVQAAACAQVDRADHRLRRGQRQLKRARGLCRDLSKRPGWTSTFAQAALHGANACACLIGQPAAGRRLLQLLRQSFVALDELSIFGSFLQLFRLDHPESHQLPLWLSAWGKAFDEAHAAEIPGDGIYVRRDYFLHAFQSMAEEGLTAEVLFPLLLTWPERRQPDPETDGPDDIDLAFQQLLSTMGLTSSDYEGRRHELEALLDQVELFLEGWGALHGA